MKKILYVTTVSRTINAFLVPHIEMLNKEMGYKVDMACCIDKEIDKSLFDLGSKVYNLPFSRNPLAISNMKAFKQLIKIQKENNYDIVHVHTPVASIFGRLLKLKFKNLKTIYTAHGYHFFKDSSKLSWFLYYPIEKIMAKITDITININQEDYEITKNRLKPQKCYLMNGVGLDLNKYEPMSDFFIAEKRKSLGLEKDDFVIIMIAELNKNKNQMQLIKAMELLKDDYPNIKALLVGEGENRKELEKEIKIRNLENNIQILGFRTDVIELINISNIGTLLSYREGLPRSIMEIMANGKKVIGTDIRGIRDLIGSENTVAIGDFFYLAEEIKLYYEKKKELIVFKEIIEKYDIENIKKIIKKVHS